MPSGGMVMRKDFEDAIKYVRSDVGLDRTPHGVENNYGIRPATYTARCLERYTAILLNIDVAINRGWSLGAAQLQQKWASFK